MIGLIAASAFSITASFSQYQMMAVRYQYPRLLSNIGGTVDFKSILSYCGYDSGIRYKCIHTSYRIIKRIGNYIICNIKIYHGIHAANAILVAFSSVQ